MMRRTSSWMLIFSICCLVGCVKAATVGGFPVSGTVLNNDTGSPVEGVTVQLFYESVSVYKTYSKENGQAVSDTDGRFYITQEEMVIWGGAGGSSGYIGKWPTLWLTKSGYCDTRYVDEDENAHEKYLEIIIEMQRGSRGDCD